MQADIGTLFIVDMDGYLRTRLQVPARRQLIVLEVSPDEVIGLAGRNALGELALMVREQLPLRLLVVGAADLYFHSVQRTSVGVKYGSKDKCVVFSRGMVVFGAGCARRQQERGQSE